MTYICVGTYTTDNPSDLTTWKNPRVFVLSDNHEDTQTCIETIKRVTYAREWNNRMYIWGITPMPTDSGAIVCMTILLQPQYERANISELFGWGYRRIDPVWNLEDIIKM